MTVIMKCVNIKLWDYTELFSLHIERPSYVKLGKNMPEIKEDLQKVNGGSRFTNSCIHKWFHRFSDGRKSVKDDPRSG